MPDEGDIPPILDFFCGGKSETFCFNCEMLGLNKENAELVDFICFQQEEEIFQDNSLSIQLESQNI